MLDDEITAKMKKLAKLNLKSLLPHSNQPASGGRHMVGALEKMLVLSFIVAKSHRRKGAKNSRNFVRVAQSSSLVGRKR